MPKTKIGTLSDKLENARITARVFEDQNKKLSIDLDEADARLIEANKRIKELREENEQLLIREKWCNKSNVRLRDSQHRARMLLHSLIDMALFKQEEEDKDG